MAASASPRDPTARQRRPTATSRFGVSRRESHDATDFYDRFPAPDITDDGHVAPPTARDQIWVGDARAMDRHGDIADASVALVVTSPPYFAGKEYELSVGRGHVPGSYRSYLQMLEDVFRECVRKLEPGGRVAVNVANLGRKPYRSLSADVITILQDRLGLLLRGEIIWQKARGAAGNCAWGSFARPSNPVLRDLTERVVVASKGRFDRAVPARERLARRLPSVATISADEFMDLTLDVWELPAERATRVGHPAPFPVELPRRLIDLYTYEGDLVLDPFMGVGSTAVAAVRTGRHFVGFDTDPGYVAAALERVAGERRSLAAGHSAPGPGRIEVRAPAAPDGAGWHERALRAGQKATTIAREALERAGFRQIRPNASAAPGVVVSFRASDAQGHAWLFDVVGALSAGRPGLRRSETLWKALGKATVIAASSPEARLVLMSTDLPDPRSASARALDRMRHGGSGLAGFDVVHLLDATDLSRLAGLCRPARPAAHSNGSAPELAGTTGG